MSSLYINRLLYYFEFLENDKLYITRELIEKYINTNDIIVLPFIVKLNKIYPQSSGRETLKGHTLPIVGLAQMKNGLILSGSYGLLKIWKKNCDIKSDNYSCFEILHTVNYYNDLIQNFIELEENTIAFIKGKQIFEAIINKDGPQYFKELFQYQIAGNCLESLTSINNNKHLVGGLYQKIYIYKRSNPFPIYTLQYHEFFIKRLISIPVLNLFCSSGSDHKIILYNAENFEFFNAFNFEESHIVGLCNYNDTDFCASTMGGKLWYFKWNEKNNNHDRIGPINAHKKEIYGIAQLKNGNVASVSRDSTIKIWDVDKLICLCKIETCANDLVIQLIDGRLCCASNNHLVSIYNNLPIVKEFNFFSL
jgi:WD40 repeat protein